MLTTQTKEELIKEALAAILPAYKKRIFGEGTASDNSPIGVYKGTTKRVTLVDTGQLRNDVQVIVVGNKIGIGVQTQESHQKVVAIQERFKKRIFQLTEQEKQQLRTYIQQRIKDLFSAQLRN